MITDMYFAYLNRVMSQKKSNEELSRDVYEAFQTISVTSEMILRRRHDHLLQETLYTTRLKFLGDSCSLFIVGSQVEESTTLGMKSDIDQVARLDSFHVVLRLGAWQTGKINLLAFKDETTPPQFYKLCRLQKTPDGRHEYMRDPIDDTDIVDKKGRVLITNTWVDTFAMLEFKNLGEEKLIMNGPSRSFDDRLDLVLAFPCNDVPEECEDLYQRSRPGHWPKTETFEYARQCPVFFVPQGHPHSPLNERQLQWRLSTTQSDSSCLISLKNNILLKMLKKENCKAKFGDNFSTFHIKTAMLFTIERHSPGTWCIDNIVVCATYCIDTLVQWAHDKV